MASLAVLRNILFMLDNKYGRGKNIYTLLFIILSLIVRTIFTYDGLLSLLPVIATLLYTISVWVDDNDLKRFSDSDEKDLYSMLQLRKTGNADRKEDRPVTYISTMEVNSFLRKRGIFKKMCKMLINFVNHNQHIVTTKQTEMGLMCKTFDTLQRILISNGFMNSIFEDNNGMIHSELHDIVCSKQKVLKK